MGRMGICFTSKAPQKYNVYIQSPLDDSDQEL